MLIPIFLLFNIFLAAGINGLLIPSSFITEMLIISAIIKGVFINGY